MIDILNEALGTKFPFLMFAWEAIDPNRPGYIVEERGSEREGRRWIKPVFVVFYLSRGNAWTRLALRVCANETEVNLTERGQVSYEVVLEGYESIRSLSLVIEESDSLRWWMIYWCPPNRNRVLLAYLKSNVNPGVRQIPY
jgi:hypothetical protein